MTDYTEGLSERTIRLCYNSLIISKIDQKERFEYEMSIYKKALTKACEMISSGAMYRNKNVEELTKIFLKFAEDEINRGGITE